MRPRYDVGSGDRSYSSSRRSTSVDRCLNGANFASHNRSDQARVNFFIANQFYVSRFNHCVSSFDHRDHAKTFDHSKSSYISSVSSYRAVYKRSMPRQYQSTWQKSHRQITVKNTIAAAITVIRIATNIINPSEAPSFGSHVYSFERRWLILAFLAAAAFANLLSASSSIWNFSARLSTAAGLGSISRSAGFDPWTSAIRSCPTGLPQL